MKRNISLIVGLALFWVLTATLNQTTLAEPQSPASLANWLPPQWDGSEPGAQVSASLLNKNAAQPDIEYSASGARLMVVYSQTIDSSNSDPWYNVSTSNGSSWSDAQQARASTGTQSQGISLAFTGEKAHLVWVEYNTLTKVNQLLALSETSANNWGSAISISSLPQNFPMFEPELVARGNRLHVVWTEGLPQKLYHAWLDVGSTWSTKAPISNLDAFESDVAVDANGFVHVVWTKINSSTNVDVYYARSTNNSAPYSWSTPIPVSMGKQDSRPNITENDGLIRISFTRIDANLRARQHVVYTECSNNCTSSSGWTTPSSITISEGYVGANDTSPFNVIADMIDDPGNRTTYIYFHGYDPLVSTNEVLWGVNSCQSWGVRDTPITDSNNQALRPSIAIHDTSLQLVYERIPGGSGVSEVYHRRATIEFCPYRVQLPIVFKQ